jgi:hypothetical protein
VRQTTGPAVNWGGMRGPEQWASGDGAVWATNTTEIGFDYLRPLIVKLGSSVDVPRRPLEQLLTGVPR